MVWSGGATDLVPIISCVLIRTGPPLIRGLHKCLPVILKFLEDRLPEIHEFLERSINFPPITGFSCGPALYSYIEEGDLRRACRRYNKVPFTSHTAFLLPFITPGPASCNPSL